MGKYSHILIPFRFMALVGHIIATLYSSQFVVYYIPLIIIIIAFKC